MSISETISTFTGTEQYHKLTMGSLKFTDGMKYLAEEAKAFWLMDIIGSVQHLPSIKDTDFIVWVISKTEKGWEVGAYSDCEADGSYSIKKRLYFQSGGYTSFPFDELGASYEFYQEGDVILLKSEH